MLTKSARYPTMNITKEAITWNAELYVVRKFIGNLSGGCVLASQF
jgi:hypothetical protein